MQQVLLAAVHSESAACLDIAGTVSIGSGPQLPPSSAGEAPPNGANEAGFQRGRLLWIDDEVRPGDAVVRLLEIEGFRVDCASSGTTGLAMARRNLYVGIILDVRLPDIPGLTVLETLTRQHVPVPILVLTGFPDFDVAVQAMRRGAWDCQSKAILLGDEWMDLVRTLAQHGANTDSLSLGLLSTRGAIGGELLGFLDELRNRTGSPLGAGLQRSHVALLQTRLLRTMADRRLNVFLFLVCAKALRLALSAREHTLSSILQEIADVMRKARAVDQVTPDWRVQATLAKLAESDTRVGHVREEEAARMLGVDRAHLGRLLRATTGFTFKQWRWGFLLRPALLQLAASHEQIAQIAYSCGYGSVAQFDRDFRRVVHMTPTQYRQLVWKASQ